MSRYLDDYYDEIKANIAYDTTLLKRIEELKARYAAGNQNIGNYWIRSIPGFYRYHVVNGQSDKFGRIELSSGASELLFSERVNPFVNYGFTSYSDTESWYAGISETYIKELLIKLPEGYEYDLEGMYLCTHVNMGPIGKFDTSIIDKFRKVARESHGYEVEAKPVRGTIASRFKNDGELHVVMELQINID